MNTFEWIIISSLPILIAIGFGIYAAKTNQDFFMMIGVALGVLIFLVEIAAISSYSQNNTSWETAVIYKRVPKEQITIVDLPNGNISVWVENKEVYTIKEVTEYIRREQIDRIEYRRQEVSGLDFDEGRLIFEDGTKSVNRLYSK